MFLRRFLQTSVSLQKPLKSKLHRYETIKKEIEAAYKLLKAERLRNLNLIEGSSEFASIKIGKIPTVNSIIKNLENCQNWDQIKSFIPVLREIRFLGSPKRTEISNSLLGTLEWIYAADSDDQNLMDCLNVLLSYEQLNPLIIPEGTDPASSTKIINMIQEILSK